MNMAITASTLYNSDLPLAINSNLYATNTKFTKINTFAPITASLFGVMPNSEIRNTIAESARLFKMMVSVDSPTKNHKLIFSFFF